MSGILCFPGTAEGGIKQKAWRVIAESDNRIIWDSGKIESDEMSCHFPCELNSRQRVFWKVSLWDGNDVSSGWSEESWFEMAFLDKNC